jgi:hypothetical protein
MVLSLTKLFVFATFIFCWTIVASCQPLYVVFLVASPCGHVHMQHADFQEVQKELGTQLWTQ